MKKLHAASSLQRSLNLCKPPYRKPPELTLLALLLLGLILIFGYAVFKGEPVKADIGPVHLEVGGRAM